MSPHLAETAKTRDREPNVKTLIKRIWIEDQGVLTFEWVLLITIVVIGIVGGVSAARDAIIDELGDVAGAVVSVDQSYTVTTDACLEIGNEFGFDDPAPNFGECEPGETNVSRQRSGAATSQTVEDPCQ